MELIKQIKGAEKQAKDITEKARQDSATLLEEATKQRLDLLKESQQRRIKALDDAIHQAELDGKYQADQIAQTGSKAISALKVACSQEIDSCVEKILSRLQQG